MRRQKLMTLPFIISMLILLSVITTATASGYAAFKANKESLISSYLESNLDYAKKLSSDTDGIVSLMKQNVDSIAKAQEQGIMTQESLNLWMQSNKGIFNSIFIADKSRTIQLFSSATSTLSVGTVLTSNPSLDAVALKKPLISEPYIGNSGRVLVLVSAPVFNEEGVYEGFVGGSIYLQEENVLSRLLRDHFHKNGSYVYVVDSKGTILFHPDPKRVNVNVLKNLVVQKVIAGKEGSEPVINTRGQSFLAGYSYMESTGWGIVSQTPSAIVNEPLKSLIYQMFLQSLPACLLIVLCAIGVAVFISIPLNKLAKFSEEATSRGYIKNEQMKMPNMKLVIYEVRQLYQHISNHLNFLSAEIGRDGLTGLANRRAFDITIQEWMQNRHTFSLILIDIDNFKCVNDTYGHVAGDEVLKSLADVMCKMSREQDICFRYGGEEFCLLVDSEKREVAYTSAEQLRRAVEKMENITGEPITISLGISTYEKDYQTPDQLIKEADSVLYEAKSKGKNKTIVYNRY
ncbi:sensor domain-containing diguanylate cyclase [Domibacillus mangrovi]|uniref:sensor domain-containing diguanylate cyclase n=1 Tax=Domibacillus mangrovi TaxID=1714354 RepID=UPI00135644F9|nr:sensor domain-containing diguanylate cyclase [Domibacillus mangrovi]